MLGGRLKCFLEGGNNQFDKGKTEQPIRLLKEFLEPEHIIVVDNGNSSSPLDDTKKEIQDGRPDSTRVHLTVDHSQIQAVCIVCYTCCSCILQRNQRKKPVPMESV